MIVPDETEECVIPLGSYKIRTFWSLRTEAGGAVDRIKMII